jgi:hypothetical protein
MWNWRTVSRKDAIHFAWLYVKRSEVIGTGLRSDDWVVDTDRTSKNEVVMEAIPADSMNGFRRNLSEVTPRIGGNGPRPAH